MAGYALRSYSAQDNFLYEDDDIQPLLVYIMSQIFIFICPYVSRSQQSFLAHEKAGPFSSWPTIMFSLESATTFHIARLWHQAESWLYSEALLPLSKFLMASASPCPQIRLVRQQRKTSGRTCLLPLSPSKLLSSWYSWALLVPSTLASSEAKSAPTLYARSC